MKGFVIPTNPSTSKQQTTRATFASLVQSWQGLSAAQQQAWKDAAPNFPYTNRLGDVKEYTGQVLYIKLNRNLLEAGQSVINTPPTPKSFTSTTLDTLTMDLTAGSLTTADVDLSGAPDAAEATIITTTVQMSPGVTAPSQSRFKSTKVVAGASAAATVDIISEYQALYGDPPVGAKVFCAVDLIHEGTGQRLRIGQVSTIVTTT